MGVTTEQIIATLGFQQRAFDAVERPEGIACRSILQQVIDAQMDHPNFNFPRMIAKALLITIGLQLWATHGDDVPSDDLVEVIAGCVEALNAGCRRDGILGRVVEILHTGGLH